MSNKITTVCGEIEKKDAGIMLPHEHLLINLEVFTVPPEDKEDVFYKKLALNNLKYVRKEPYSILDNAIIDDVEVAINEAKFFKSAGGATIVDVTLDTIGRNPEKLKRISQESGVNVVMGSGFYVDKAHPAFIKEKTVKELAIMIISDIEKGVNNSDIKAGIIGEIGTSAEVSENEFKCLEAAGIAHLSTGKAIHIHTSLYETNGLQIVDKLVKMGVNPQKIAIDHIDVDIREDYIEQLLDKGVFVEFDNFGKEFYISNREGNTLNGRFAYDLERAQTIKHLTDKGYTERILLTNDICLKSMLCEYGGFGYAHILNNIIPMLYDCGISEKDINKMIEENPISFIC